MSDPRSSTLLDQYLPAYDITEVHQGLMHAAPERVYRAITEVTTAEMPLFRLLYAIRMWPDRLAGRGGDEFAPGRRLVDWVDEVGFLLEAKQDVELVFGVIGQFWKLRGGHFHHYDGPAEFMAFDQPDYVKVATNFTLAAAPDGRSTLLRTETRILALDEATRRKFGAYWFFIYPGSSLIRREWLHVIAWRAEQPERH